MAERLEADLIVEGKLESFREEVNSRFVEVRSDIRELTKALRDLIRLDGDIKRIQDQMLRLSKVVDQHELYIGDLRLDSNTSTITISKYERLFWFIMAIGSSVLTAIVVKSI